MQRSRTPSITWQNYNSARFQRCFPSLFSGLGVRGRFKQQCSTRDGIRTTQKMQVTWGFTWLFERRWSYRGGEFCVCMGGGWGMKTILRSHYFYVQNEGYCDTLWGPYATKRYYLDRQETKSSSTQSSSLAFKTYLLGTKLWYKDLHQVI